MNVFDDFTIRIKKIIEALDFKPSIGGELDLSKVIVEPPRDSSHGDLATNAALVLAKPTAMKPRDIAVRIAAALVGDPDVEKAEVAGPGFINIGLQPSFWTRYLAGVIAAGESFGRGDIGGGERVNVEYVSANPTGPMHVGHCRGAVVGDALASLLDFAGYSVLREYYINDAGVQVDILARSAFLRYCEALGEDIGDIPEGLYPGDYLKPVGAVLAETHGDALLNLEESEWLPVVRQVTIDRMMDVIRRDLDALNVRHDTFFSESSLVTDDNDLVAEAIAALREKNLIYVGTLPPPKGQLPDDWEDREQTLFRATEFGDDIDRPLLKSDESYTYFASDIAYHYDKYRRGYKNQIDIWGADHGGYIKRMQAAVTAVTGGEASLDVKICQLVKLFRAGEPVRMSKRSGDFVTLRDVVEEVGRDAVRFMMLYRKNDAPLDFDFQKVTEQSRDNPVFYVQYAHARCASVFRQAGEVLPDVDFGTAALQAATLDRLGDDGELGMIAKIAEWPRLAEAAADAQEPHRVAFYLYDLASSFHAHWNRGKDLPQLRFINAEDRQLSVARLALVHGVRLVIRAGLAILGVDAPNEMR